MLVMGVQGVIEGGVLYMMWCRAILAALLRKKRLQLNWQTCSSLRDVILVMENTKIM